MKFAGELKKIHVDLIYSRKSNLNQVKRFLFVFWNGFIDDKAFGQAYLFFRWRH